MVEKMSEFLHEFGNEMARHSMSDFSVAYQMPEKAPTGLSTAYHI